MKEFKKHMILAELIQKELDGCLTDQEFTLLGSLLKEDNEAVIYYVKTIRAISAFSSNSIIPSLESVEEGKFRLESFESGIWKALAEAEKEAPAVQIPQEKPAEEPIQKVERQNIQIRINRSSLITLLLSMAAMVLFVLIVRFIPSKTGIEVATLNAAVGARWTDSVAFSKSGDRICASETFSLGEGLVEIKTDKEVDLIVEGPAEFDFTKDGDLRLDRGKVYAIVPVQGIGFTITTPTSKIIDLGTEFGVQADKIGSTEAHVYKGQVTLMASNPSHKKTASAVTEGQARLIHTDGTVSHKPIDNHLFVRKEEFAVNVRASQGSHYDRWLAYSYKLRRNPDLTAYYTFEQDKSLPGILKNKAVETEGRLDGNLHSATGGPLPTWTNGRWPEKTALHFNRIDRQAVIVPGDAALNINGPITIAAWVRCSALKEGGHIVSCRIPDGNGNYQFGYKSPRDEDKWTGKIQFARIKYPLTEPLTDRVFSDQIFTLSPQWRFIAVTHDNQAVKMYVDGEYAETHDFVFKQEPVNAELIIGGDHAAEDPTRFKGDMCELMIFKRALDADEINEIYKAGQP